MADSDAWSTLPADAADDPEDAMKFNMELERQRLEKRKAADATATAQPPSSATPRPPDSDVEAALRVLEFVRLYDPLGTGEVLNAVRSPLWRDVRKLIFMCAQPIMTSADFTNAKKKERVMKATSKEKVSWMRQECSMRSQRRIQRWAECGHFKALESVTGGAHISTAAIATQPDQTLIDIAKSSRKQQTASVQAATLAAIPPAALPAPLASTAGAGAGSTDGALPAAGGSINRQLSTTTYIPELAELLVSATDATGRSTGCGATPSSDLKTADPDVAFLNSVPQSSVDGHPHTFREVPIQLSCYVCKEKYTLLHSFYDSMCPPCAVLNWEKRQQTADLTGKTALVTGGRIKIGANIALRLLRCGATVHVTTRFSADAHRRYHEQSDYATWSHRLFVHQLDLLDIESVEVFARRFYPLLPESGLDILINNAAQTVRQNIEHFASVLAPEQPLPASLAAIAASYHSPPEKIIHCYDPSLSIYAPLLPTPVTTLPSCAVFAAATTGQLLLPSGESLPLPPPSTPPRSAAAAAAVAAAVAAAAQQRPSSSSSPSPSSAAIDTMPTTSLTDSFSRAAVTKPLTDASADAPPVLPSVRALSTTSYPTGGAAPDGALVGVEINDENSTLVAKAPVATEWRNSWRMKMDAVESWELLECLAINSVGPFILIAKLRPALRRAAQTSARAFVVNVSAVEGRFAGWKSHNHAHTNMAKAALNMLTRTSAADFARECIYMNSVDTGWVTDENPAGMADQRFNDGWMPPLDELDGAMRVLDPVLRGYAANEIVWGRFLKDYREMSF